MLGMVMIGGTGCSQSNPSSKKTASTVAKSDYKLNKPLLSTKKK